MVFPKEESTIINWIAEYTAYHAWNNFNKKLEHQFPINRDFLQGLLNLIGTTEVQDGCSLLLHLIVMLCRLIDGEEACAFYNSQEPEECSALVAFLQILDNLGKPMLSTPDMTELQQAVSVQAVFVCIRAGEFDLAQTVYDQVEKYGFSVDVRPVLKRKDSHHRLLQEHAYESMLTQAKRLLAPLFKQCQQPTLYKLAQHYNTNSTEESPPSRIHLSRAEVKACLSELDLKDDTVEDVLQRDKVQSSTFGYIGKIRQKKADLLKTLPDCLDKSQFLSAKKTSQTKMRSREREHGGRVDDTFTEVSSSSRQSTADGDVYNFSDTSLFDESSPTRRKVKTSTSKTSLKRPWTPKEEATLYRLIKGVGAGKWASMVPHFTMRTNVDIKDKWRNMCKSRFLYSHLVQEHGDWFPPDD